jgi:hypothetical protein
MELSARNGRIDKNARSKRGSSSVRFLLSLRS